MFQHRRLAEHKAIILGLAVVVFFFAKVIYDIRTEHHLAISTAEQRAKRLASALNEHALRTFNDAEGTIDSMIRSINTLSSTSIPDENTLQPVFAGHRRPRSVFATIFVANPQGFLHGVATEYPVRHIPVQDREYFRHHLSSSDPALFISKPFRNRLDNAWLITVSRRLSYPDGSLRMIVGVAIRTEYFSNFYRTLEMGRRDTIQLVRSDGAILSLEPFSEQTLIGNQSAPAKSRPELTNYPGVGSYTLEGAGFFDGRIVSYRSSEDYPVIALISLDKADHLIQWRARALKDAAGALLFVLLVGSLALVVRRQLANLRQANLHLSNRQAELKQAKRRSQEIVNNIDGIVWEFDPAASRFTFVSQRSEAITGYPPHLWLADRRFWSSRVHPGDTTWTECLKEHGAGNKGGASFEYRFRAKSGDYLWLRDIVTCVSEEGEAPHLRGVMLDISQEKQAAEALRLSEQRFRELMETIQLVSVILDPAGKISFCNDYLLQTTGWSREEVIGKDWFDLFLPQQVREKVRAFFDEGVKSGAIDAHYENPIQTRDGEIRTISWDNTVLHNADGSLAGMASIGRDMTHYRILEEQLRQSQKMEATGLLAGGVAHDFNNILTVIIGYCSVMQMRLPPDDPNRASVDHVLAAAERASGLTRSLLAFSRKQVMNPNQVDLNDIVRHVEHFLCRVIGEDITLKAELHPEGLNVLVDRGQIEQILMNMATNARDAMPDGGVLSIGTQVIGDDAAPVDGSPTGRYAVLTISDTGHGMEETVRSKIFEPFYTTKEVGKGTGLGLAMAYGTVMQHNGRISVESEPGKGTCFKVYLPLVPYREPAPKQEVSPFEPDSGHELILVAEDEPAVRELVQGILTRFGYRVVLAEDGEDAVTRFREHRDDIELVLLDLIMPKMSGKAAYDEICSIKPGVRAIFTSGYTADVIRNKGELGAGMELVMKPVHPHQLLRKVREMLDGRSPSDPPPLSCPPPPP